MISLGNLKGEKQIMKKTENTNRIDLSEISIQRRWDFFNNNGRITDNKWRELGPYEGIMNVWEGEPCYVVGGGMSLDGFNFSLLDGHHSIGINHMIDFYDGFEWLIFLDQRFLDLNTYDLKKFKGRIFTQNIVKLPLGVKMTVFKSNNVEPSKHITNGLFKTKLTGLCALNLAIMTGADPIYLLGFDGGALKTEDKRHHIQGYVSEKQTDQYCKNYEIRSDDFEAFAPWKDRIVNLSPMSNIHTFKKQAWQEHFKKPPHFVEVVPQNVEVIPKIIHYANIDDSECMAEASRHLIAKAFGNHMLKKFINKPEKADLYILHHYRATNKEVLSFPHKEKAIVVVHSATCIPRGNFKKVITLTETWKAKLEKAGIKNVEVITNGLDIDAYRDDNVIFENKAFGRITRWTNGKIHPGWSKLVKEIITEYEDVRNIMFVQMQGGKERPEGPRIIYNEGVKINEYKGQYLKQLSVYVHANHGFKEICNHGLIEALATGLPIVLLYEDSSAEVIGDAGIICKTIEEVKEKIIFLLTDKEAWLKYARLSKERAKFFNLQKMIKSWNELIKQSLKK